MQLGFIVRSTKTVTASDRYDKTGSCHRKLHMTKKILLTLFLATCIAPVVFLQFKSLRIDWFHEVETQTHLHSTATAARTYNVTYLTSLLGESGFNATVHIVFAGQTFTETAFGIRDAFVRAGLREPALAVVSKEEPRPKTFSDEKQLHLMLGAHGMASMPTSYIVYNLEQLSSPWMTDEYYNNMKQALAVAHFSQDGIALLQQKVAPVSVTYLPVYVPFNSSISSYSTSSLATAVVPRSSSVDVGFYGSYHARRIYIEQQLQLAGLTTDFRMGYDLWSVPLGSATYLLLMLFHCCTECYMLERTLPSTRL
jgi:hypothetical protein